jgi:hypothetical protein
MTDIFYITVIKTRLNLFIAKITYKEEEICLR